MLFVVSVLSMTVALTKRSLTPGTTRSTRSGLTYNTPGAPSRKRTRGEEEVGSPVPFPQVDADVDDDVDADDADDNPFAEDAEDADVDAGRAAEDGTPEESTTRSGRRYSLRPVFPDFNIGNRTPVQRKRRRVASPPPVGRKPTIDMPGRGQLAGRRLNFDEDN